MTANNLNDDWWKQAVVYQIYPRSFADASAALLAGMLAAASWSFVASEIDAGRELAYGLPVWAVQVLMPVGFAILAVRLGARGAGRAWVGVLTGTGLAAAGFLFARHFDGSSLPLLPFVLWLLAVLLAGAPVFAALGGLALALFWSEGQPLASVPLSHYQITVNPSLPALPLFTLAGLVFARSGAAARLGALFTACFGGGALGTVAAAAVLCSFFTAFTGGSGVTILALGGLLLPLLRDAGVPERRGISLVTSASALGVLLAPSVPLIMYAIIARVPINTMFLAGVLPAVVMVVFLLLAGGYLRRGKLAVRIPAHEGARALCRRIGSALVSTSCNRSGKRACRSEREVRRQFGRAVLVIGGRTGARKAPSRIIDWASGQVLR